MENAPRQVPGESRYEYMTPEDSVLFDRALTNDMTREEACANIVKLIQKLTSLSRAEHRASTY